MGPNGAHWAEPLGLGCAVACCGVCWLRLAAVPATPGRGRVPFVAPAAFGGPCIGCFVGGGLAVRPRRLRLLVGCSLVAARVGAGPGWLGRLGCAAMSK